MLLELAADDRRMEEVMDYENTYPLAPAKDEDLPQVLAERNELRFLLEAIMSGEEMTPELCNRIDEVLA